MTAKSPPPLGHLVLIGCGAMGSALLKGWLGASQEGAEAFSFSKISVVAPREESVAPFLKDTRVSYHGSPETLPGAPDVLIFAAKPSMTGHILPLYRPLCTAQTVFISVAAGKSCAHYRHLLGPLPILVRVMPNTPSAVGHGVALLTGENPTSVPETLKAFLMKLMGCVGQSYWVTSEEELDRATTLSGCGPAYLFAIVEALQKAGEFLGLSPSLVQALTHNTLEGALTYLHKTPKSAAVLRAEVTSPGGMTQAALGPLLDPATGLAPLFQKALHAAYQQAITMRQDDPDLSR